MNETIAKLHSDLDKALARTMAEAGAKPPCCLGCYHCCREPVYASLSEVQHMLELLTPEKKAAVAERARKWMEDFKASGMDQLHQPPAVKYRTFNLWCPLLDGVKCSVYERRPVGCRTHFAMDSKAGCEDDALRQHQKFVLFEGLSESLSQWQQNTMKDGDTEVYDSLGVLIARELLGEDSPSASRIEASINGDELTLLKYEEDVADQNPS